MSRPVLVVCCLEDFQGKVFDVGCTSGLGVDGVIRADFFLEAFESIKKIEKETARARVLRFEGYAKLRSVVGTCTRVSDKRRAREETYTNTRRRVRGQRALLCAGEMGQWI